MNHGSVTHCVNRVTENLKPLRFVLRVQQSFRLPMVEGFEDLVEFFG